MADADDPERTDAPTEPKQDPAPQPATLDWFDKIRFKENIGLNVFVPKNFIGKLPAD